MGTTSIIVSNKRTAAHCRRPGSAAHSEQVGRALPHLIFRYLNDGKHPNPSLKILVHPNSVLPADNGKSVHWKLGADEEVWVWVMGEHHLDKPYDTLCDEILAQRARLKSGQEVRELRYEPAGP